MAQLSVALAMMVMATLVGALDPMGSCTASLAPSISTCVTIAAATPTFSVGDNAYTLPVPYSTGLLVSTLSSLLGTPTLSNYNQAEICLEACGSIAAGATAYAVLLGTYVSCIQLSGDLY